jgi:hypothetical protein
LLAELTDSVEESLWTQFVPLRSGYDYSNTLSNMQPTQQWRDGHHV